MKYSEYQDGLAALISHLGLVSNKSRTPHFIAMDTGIEKQRAEEILDGFPGIFSPHSPDERRFRPIATHDSMGKSIA